MPAEGAAVLLAERMHWTLDYVREMDIADRLLVEQVIYYRDLAEQHEAIRASERLAARGL